MRGGFFRPNPPAACSTWPLAARSDPGHLTLFLPIWRGGLPSLPAPGLGLRCYANLSRGRQPNLTRSLRGGVRRGWPLSSRGRPGPGLCLLRGKLPRGRTVEVPRSETYLAQIPLLSFCFQTWWPLTFGLLTPLLPIPRNSVLVFNSFVGFLSNKPYNNKPYNFL